MDFSPTSNFKKNLDKNNVGFFHKSGSFEARESYYHGIALPDVDVYKYLFSKKLSFPAARLGK